jgi:hypothetical protein
MLALLLGLKSVQLVRAAAGAVGNTPEASAVVTPAQAAPIQPVAKDALPAPMFAPQPVAPPPEPDGVPATISDSERNLLLELRQRRQDLDTREASLAARESMMVAAEQRLGARVAELQALQKTLEALDAARKQREDASWLGLVDL